MPNRCAVYTRISLDREGESDSPARQEAACRQLAEAKGYEVVRVFKDVDASAYDRKAKRPQYDEMMEGLRGREFDAVVVWKLDRLTRRYVEAGPIIKALHDAGAVLLSVQDSIDTTTPNGQAIMGFIVSQAETESLNTSLRLRSKWDAAARRGEPHKGGSRCFGYARDMTVIPEEAAVAREVVKRVLDGESIRQVAFDLNERGVRTPGGREWSWTVLGRWLRSPRLAGLRGHNGTEYPGNWTPIITPGERIEIMRAIAARGRGGQSNKTSNLLPGLIYCGRCGGRLKTMGFRMKNGKSFPRYQCVQNPGDVNCGRVAVTLTSVDAHVRDRFLDFLSRAELRPLPDEQRADELAGSLAEDEQAMIDLTRARFVERKLDPDSFEAARLELEERIDQAKATLAVWQREATDQAGALRPGERGDLEKWWEAHPLEDQRVALRHAIRRVVIQPAKHRGGNRFDTERVKIEWNWSLYLRAAEQFESTATPEDRKRAKREYEKLQREANEELSVP